MIQVKISIAHTCLFIEPFIIAPLLVLSLQKTLQDWLSKHGMDVLLDENNDCFVLNTTNIPFQDNIGLHTTTIESIRVTIPYQRANRVIQGTSKDKIAYGASISILYQQVSPSNQSSSDRVADIEAENEKMRWGFHELSYFVELNDKPAPFYNDYFGPNEFGEFKLDARAYQYTVVLHRIRSADEATNQRISTLFQQRQLLGDIIDVGTSFMISGALGGTTHTTALFDYRQSLGWRKKSTVERGLFPEMTVEECRNYHNNKTAIVAAKSRPMYWLLCGTSMGMAYLLRHMMADTAVQRCLLTAGLSFVIGPIGLLVGILGKL